MSRKLREAGYVEGDLR